MWTMRLTCVIPHLSLRGLTNPNSSPPPFVFPQIGRAEFYDYVSEPVRVGWEVLVPQITHNRTSCFH